MRPEFDVVVVGGGPVGLSLTAALQPSGLTLALIEPQPMKPPPQDDSWDSRVYALSPGTVSFLETLGAWREVTPERVTKVESMLIYGDDESARLEFSAYDAGLKELACIVENRLLHGALWRTVDPDAVRVFAGASCVSMAFEPDRARLTLADDNELAARLVVAADGADSWVREQARVPMMPHDYRQLGVVGNFSCQRSHGGVAFQWFQREGVLALLPLPGNRVSMVWSIVKEAAERLLALPADELAAKVETASHCVLGALHVITPPVAFPLRLQRVAQFVRPRLALVGDAAHNVHPLAGQGVNLGFRDARVLASTLSSRDGRYDCGDYPLLRRYERARKEDVAAMQLTTHALQKLFNNEAVWIGKARNAGLRLVNRQPQVKKFLVRQAVA